MNPEDHLDITALQDLKEIMESEFETLVNTFVADSQSKLDELSTVIERQDSDSLRKVAHSLKGSSSNVCAFRLSELARQLEMMGMDEKIAGAENILKDMQSEFAAVTSMLNNNL
jgi:HPt (histidine-containing phosphotransfer) domain-containing protein